jgi:hypothetical protein
MPHPLNLAKEIRIFNELRRAVTEANASWSVVKPSGVASDTFQAWKARILN